MEYFQLYTFRPDNEYQYTNFKPTAKKITIIIKYSDKGYGSMCEKEINGTNIIINKAIKCGYKFSNPNQPIIYNQSAMGGNHGIFVIQSGIIHMKHTEYLDTY